MSLPRVLFVDDDSDVLGGLSKALRKHRARWDMTFALGGPAALEEARRATFDVVITDMRMPEIDGASLLLAVRDHDPTTFRMILSGFSEHSAVTRALPVAHQFFDKPCDLKALAAAIDRCCALRTLFVGAPMQAVIDRLARLADPDDPTIDPDPAASARTLRLAASILLGTEPPPVEPSSAAIALAALARARIDQPASEFSMQAHALRATTVAERAQSAAVPALAANAFTAGLVHDLGRALVALGLPADHAAIELGVRAGVRPEVVERAQLGITYAELAAYALTLWGVPFEVIDAIASQDDETASPSPITLALRTALAA